MKSKPFHVLLFAILLGIPALSSQSAEILSPSIDLVDQNYLISQARPEEKVVIVTGFGIDANAATINAAENALNEIVGSIISAKTLVQKKTEIRNGIIDQAKLISRHIEDYSRGSIKALRY